MGRAARHALVALALLTVAGCAVVAPEREPKTPDRAAYREALAALEVSREEGIAHLEAFLAERRRSPLADDAAVRLAELLLEDGRTEDALQHLVRVLRTHPDADQSDRARLLLAPLQRDRGHPEAAYRTASAVRPESLEALEPEARRDAYRLLAELAALHGDRPSQLQWLAALRAIAADEELAGRVGRRIDGVVSGLSVAELEDVAEKLGPHPLAPRLHLRLAELALAAGDAAAAARALARAGAHPLDPELAGRFHALRSRLEAGAFGPELLAGLPGFGDLPPLSYPDPSLFEGTLGLVLPLSGPFARFGEESLEGVLLAAGAFDSGRVWLEVRDSRGDPSEAAAAVEELAVDPEVSAVLGPLLAAESAAAAEVADRAGLPLLPLTRREEVGRDRSHVLRVGVTPRVEVALLADYAIRELEARRFAILYPRDSLGRRFRSLFWDAVEARGGEVVGVAGYEVGVTDFAQPIRSLIGFRFVTAEEREAIEERDRLLDLAKRSPPERAAELREEARALSGPDEEPLPPFVDFDALFIPDGHDQVALIAPQLAFHELRGVRLLGPSGWNHPDLLSIGRQHVNGAVFTGAFHDASGIPFVAEFARHFEATFGHPAGSFAAQAFDAANLLLAELLLGRRDRASLLAGLRLPRSVPGASGVTTVGLDGRPEKRPHLLGVHYGRIVSIDETGEPPYLRPAPTPEEESEDDSDAEPGAEAAARLDPGARTGPVRSRTTR